MGRISLCQKEFARTWLALLRVAVVLLASFGATQVEARRLALVIGNDEYLEQPALQKAVGDARAVKATLEGLGFDVQIGENLGLENMDAQISQFQDQIRLGDLVAFHFAGHGISESGRNYLIPIDFKSPKSGQDGATWLRRTAFDAGEIIDRLSGSGASLTIAILDACRDNPLAGDTRSIGRPRGLERMDPPAGVFIIFSAGPGQAALDRLGDSDDASTSIFTRVFVPILETPDLTLVTIAKRTQVEVRDLAASAEHAQFPDYSDRVIGDVVLNPSSPTPPLPPQPPSSEEDVPLGSESWAAIAYEDYSVSPGTIFGFSNAASSKEEAVRIAIRECEKESREKGYEWNCVVTARSEEGYEPVIGEGCLSLYSNVGGIWRFAKGSTRSEADLRARSSC